MVAIAASLARPAVAVASARSAGARRTFMGTPMAQRQQVVKARRSLVVKAETSTEGAVDVEALVKDLSEKWDKVENKTSVIVYGAGALVVLWLSATIVGALNNVPLFPKLFELVGLGYSAWFTYRYLLFKSSREELLEDVEALKKKISGDQ